MIMTGIKDFLLLNSKYSPKGYSNTIIIIIIVLTFILLGLSIYNHIKNKQN